MRSALSGTSAAALLCVAIVAWAQPPAGERIVAPPETAADLRVVDARIGADGSIDAAVENLTSAVMQDVKLLVKHTWYWKNERHPGEDNPGRSAYVSVPGEIAPNGSTPFTYTPSPPLPVRSDGHFETTVTVQSFTQIGG